MRQKYTISRLSNLKPEKHIEQTKRNDVVFFQLKKTAKDCQEWQVTVLFYTALHYVDAYVVKKTKLRPSNHEDRMEHVKMLLPKIRGEYKTLYEESRHARYDCIRFGNDDVVSFEKLLNDIKKEISPHIP